MKHAKPPRPGLTGPQMYIFPGLMTGMPLLLFLPTHLVLMRTMTKGATEPS